MVVKEKSCRKTYKGVEQLSYSFNTYIMEAGGEQMVPEYSYGYDYLTIPMFILFIALAALGVYALFLVIKALKKYIGK